MRQRDIEIGREPRLSIFRGFFSVGILLAALHIMALQRVSGENWIPLLSARINAAGFLATSLEALEFQATAYCEQGITKSGVPVEEGIVAADLSVLPMGSLIHVESPSYSGIYQVMDTGRLVKGRIIDIYMPKLKDAISFGRQNVRVTVLQYGSRKTVPPEYSF